MKLIIKLAIFIACLSGALFSQDIDLLSSENIDTLNTSKEEDAIQRIQKDQTINYDSTDSNKILPEIRSLRKKIERLEAGEPFFEIKSSIEMLNQKVDSLKKVISSYEEGKGAIPTINEDLLNLIKIPQLKHRIELQNGTIINGEIIEEDDLGIIVQTSIGQLAIEKDRIIDIGEDAPPSAKVELMGEPFVDIFNDRQEIKGSIKNIGSKRADFVRVIANLWSPTTDLISKDSIFVSGQNKKYYSGIKSDSALEPGSISKFIIVVPISQEIEVSYITYNVRWESYK